MTVTDPLLPTLRKCPACKEFLADSEFGVHPHCLACKRAYTRALYIRTKLNGPTPPKRISKPLNLHNRSQLPLCKLNCSYRLFKYSSIYEDWRWESNIVLTTCDMGGWYKAIIEDLEGNGIMTLEVSGKEALDHIVLLHLFSVELRIEEE